MSDDADDRRVAELYREAGRELPPSRLDERILAASRRAAGGTPRPLNPFSARWQLPLSLAAVCLVVVLLVPLLADRMEEEPLPTPAGAPPAAELERVQEAQDVQSRLPEADGMRPGRPLRKAPAAPAAQRLEARPAPLEAEDKAVSAARPDAAREALSTDTADAWLERISRMLAAGNEAGALEQLQAFVERHPQHALPADLRALQARHTGEGR